MPAAMRTLRTKGEADAWRSVNMIGPMAGAGAVPDGTAAAYLPQAWEEKRPKRSAGDDEVDGLRPLALLVGLDVEGNALPLGQRLQAGALDRGDVHEHVAPAVIGLDETIAALGIEELDGTCHRHREAPIPMVAPPSAPAARRLGRTFAIGKERRPPKASVTPPAPTGGGTSKPAGNKIG